MAQLLELGVLPSDLANLVEERASHGTPNFFETLPQRLGRDRMHPSAQAKTCEVREALWKETLGGKLLIVSSGFREKTPEGGA